MIDEPRRNAAAGRRQPVTQRDLARSLGVSTATVSRALRHDPSLSRQTRERVHQAARVRGYSSSFLRADRSDGRSIPTVLLCTGGNSGAPEAFDRLLAGVSRECTARTMSLMLHRGAPAEREHVAALRENVVDAVLLVGQHERAFVEAVAARAPVVALAERWPGLDVDHVGTDYLAAMGELSARLGECGHDTIVFVDAAVPVGEEAQRRAAFAAARLAAGASAAAVRIVTEPCDDVGWRQLLERADGGRRACAFVCASDAVAYRMAAGLRARDVEVGAQVVVIGFDGAVPPRGQAQLPTLQVPYEALGIAAVRRLRDRLQDPSAGLCDLRLRAVPSLDGLRRLAPEQCRTA